MRMWIAFCVACLKERPHPYGHRMCPVEYGVAIFVTTLLTIFRLRSARTPGDVRRGAGVCKGEEGNGRMVSGGRCVSCVRCVRVGCACRPCAN